VKKKTGALDGWRRDVQGEREDRRKRKVGVATQGDSLSTLEGGKEDGGKISYQKKGGKKQKGSGRVETKKLHAPVKLEWESKRYGNDRRLCIIRSGKE